MHHGEYRCVTEPTYVSTGALQSLRMRVISVTLMANSLLLTSRSYRLELLLQRHKTHSVTHNIVRWF